MKKNIQIQWHTHRTHIDRGYSRAVLITPLTDAPDNTAYHIESIATKEQLAHMIATLIDFGHRMEVIPLVEAIMDQPLPGRRVARAMLRTSKVEE